MYILKHTAYNIKLGVIQSPKYETQVTYMCCDTADHAGVGLCSAETQSVSMMVQAELPRQWVVEREWIQRRCPDMDAQAIIHAVEWYKGLSQSDHHCLTWGCHPTV